MADDDDRREQARQEEWAAIARALDDPGPWPASTTSRTRNVEVLDVDRYRGLALVVAAIEHSVLEEGPVMAAHAFQWDEGWRQLGGGSAGSGLDPIDDRSRWANTTSLILRCGGGRCVPRREERRPTVGYAEVLFAPAVASAIVDRPSDRRLVDLREGPGWIAIVWAEGFEPRVAALGAAGEELDHLDPGLFRDS